MCRHVLLLPALHIPDRTTVSELSKLYQRRPSAEGLYLDKLPSSSWLKKLGRKLWQAHKLYRQD